VHAGETVPIRVAARLAGLAPEDVRVELLVGREDPDTREFRPLERHRLVPGERTGEDEVVFSIDYGPTLPGLQHYQIRMYPYHPLLCHPFEVGRMVWVDE